MKQSIIALALVVAAATGQAKDLVDTIASTGNLRTLATALKSVDLASTLQAAGPFTVFAPTDDAFAKMPRAELDTLLRDKAKLASLLRYHVVPGKLMAADMKVGDVPTLQGGPVNVSTMGGVKVNGARVVRANLAADNGVIHAIDTVLMPR